ncbi:hypothetical protein ANN_13774 [Periplaneta americana]|uniref:Uncharacterized protein n=1 Tax=Periplaneta americana TaxID=6978 RepID=A0ABQ8SVT9_PERAM|nr:hypothetical protein ANN_13774 [Periplaneta americana]
MAGLCEGGNESPGSLKASRNQAAANKFSSHLWYLVPETVVLSLFDDYVPTAVKTYMAQVILEATKVKKKEKKKTN